MPYVSLIFHETEMSSVLLRLTEVFGIHWHNLACTQNAGFQAYLRHKLKSVIKIKYATCRDMKNCWFCVCRAVVFCEDLPLINTFLWQLLRSWARQGRAHLVLLSVEASGKYWNWNWSFLRGSVYLFPKCVTWYVFFHMSISGDNSYKCLMAYRSEHKKEKCTDEWDSEKS